MKMPHQGNYVDLVAFQSIDQFSFHHSLSQKQYLVSWHHISMTNFSFAPLCLSLQGQPEMVLMSGD
jgi:hypothetical protein